MNIGNKVLVKIRAQYFPGTIKAFKIESSGSRFWRKKNEVAIVEVPLKSKFVWEKEWTEENRYVEVPVAELVVME